MLEPPADTVSASVSISIPPGPPTIWSSLKIRDIFSPASTNYRGTQIFSVLLIIGVLLGLNKVTRESLSADVSSVLIEAKILKLISSIFVSTEVIWSLFHVVVMVIFGSLMESIRGTYSLLIYIIQICLISELLTLITFLSLYYFTFDTFYLERRVCGFDAMLGAFIMCITEIQPNYVVIPNFNLLTFQYLPFTLVVMVSMLHLLGMMGITQCLMICCGTWVGWLMLRYFAPNINNPYEKGNPSDDFALQLLFPPILRLPVRAIGSITFAIFKNVGCCESPSAATIGHDRNQRTSNLSNDNLNDLVLNLSAQQGASDAADSDTDTFTKRVMSNKYHSNDANDVEAKKRQEAKNLIEKRLQQIQQEYNQRIVANQSNQDVDI